MNFAQVMTFNSLSHNAYHVATTTGKSQTPKGGFRPIRLDMTDKRATSIHFNNKRDPLSQSNKGSQHSKSLSM